MTLPKKGRRAVEVRGRRYHWLIRKQPTYDQGLEWKPMVMAVELDDVDAKGTLRVDLGVSRPDNWIAPHQTSVTPAVVREVIEAALAAGWEPEASGTFELRHALVRDRA